MSLVLWLLGSVGYAVDKSEPGQAVPGCSVLIVGFSGGWGSSVIGPESDIGSVMAGLDSMLRSKGLSTRIVEYHRTPNNMWARLAAATEIMALHHTQAIRVGAALSDFMRRRSSPRVILVGLSTGGAFVNDILIAADTEVDGRVTGIELGTPFWNARKELGNSLLIDNSGADPLPNAQLNKLVPVALLGGARFAYKLLMQEAFEFGIAFNVGTHVYRWPNTRSEIVEFVAPRFGLPLRN
jgi:hypothetical protein